MKKNLSLLFAAMLCLQITRAAAPVYLIRNHNNLVSEMPASQTPSAGAAAPQTNPAGTVAQALPAGTAAGTATQTQPAGTTAAQSAAGGTTTSQAQAVVEPKVIDVYNKNHSAVTDAKRQIAGLGDIIVVKVHGIKALLDKANAGGVKKDIKLFLDGREIDDIQPTSGAPQKDDGELEFELKRTQVNNPAWTTLLCKTKINNFFICDKIKVSVGVAGGYAENSDVDKFKIVRIRKSWFWACLTGVVFYIILLVTFRKSAMLRDAGVDLTPLNLNHNLVPDRPFSLARVQMAIWFSIVLICFLFIWLITNNDDLITGGVLGLIGISATTALSAISIDSSKGQDTVKAILDMQQQIAALNTEIVPLVQIAPTDAAAQATLTCKQNSLTQLQADLAKKIASLRVKTKGFWNDILADVNGISFHRLQMFIWTLVLVIIFVYSTWASLTMPDFSANLLALQGITAGTYLGFKFPEKQV